MNKDKHKFYMYRILQEVFKDNDLRNALVFKGGTSLMFFHGLPRFSVDLDFNILDVAQKELVYDKVKRIALNYGQIADEQMKHFGPIIVLDYGKGERNLKLELSTRCFDNHYEMKYLGGTDIRVMVQADMFAHKLCALLDRREGITGRDVFDIHFFLSKAEAVHQGIVEQRMKKPLADYLDDCIAALRTVDLRELMSNVGELLDGAYKQKMRSGKLVGETIDMLEAFKFIPQIKAYPENEMPIEEASVKTNPQGESVLVARIDGKSYTDKVLSTREKAQLQAYPEQEDKTNFLHILVKQAYYGAWRQQKASEEKSLKW